MPMGWRLATTIAAGLTLVTAHASAAPARTHWVVESEGKGCDAERESFEWELALACGAIGSCEISRTRREADHRATVVCDGHEAARVRTATSSGIVLTTVELGGDDNDRVRRAAIDIAHDPPLSEEQVITQTLRELSEHEVDSRSPEPVAKKSSFAFGGGGVAMVAPEEDLSGGGRLFAAFALRQSLHLTLGVLGAAGGSGRSSVRHLRMGGGVGVGAPFVASSVVGFGAELGAALRQAYEQTSSTRRLEILQAESRAAIFGSTSIFFQVPNLAVRPYGALSLSAFAAMPVLAGGVELGLMVPVF